MLLYRRRIRQLYLTCVLFLLYMVIYVLESDTYSQLPEDTYTILNTPYPNNQSCKFPLLNPFDESISEFVYHPIKYKCAWLQPELTYVQGNSIYKNNTEVHYYKADKFKYRSYKRPPGSDAAVQFSDWVIWDHNKPQDIQGQGVQITAGYTHKNGKRRRYEYLYPSVLPTNKKVKEPKNGQINPRPINVFIFGIDSVSRSNVIRNLPLTYRVLTEKLGGYDFRGYSKIDDNTLPNMMAVLSGHMVTIHHSELELNTSRAQNQFIDHWPFIWKNYSSHGYNTLLSEEQPGIFSYKAHGFKHTPTDVYLRPYGSIMGNMDGIYNGRKLCFGNKPEALHFLEAIKRFLQLHKDKPYFAFSFLWKWSHDLVNQIQGLDEHLADWLQSLIDERLLDNTVVMVMGDHGNRFDKIRSTLVGRYEERMPFLFMHVPDWLLLQRLDIVQALKWNTWRLTCQYDVYETLVDLLIGEYGLPRSYLKNRGRSLFSKIPIERTCKDVDIPQHFCVCQIEETLSVASELVINAVNVLIDKIRLLISDHNELCADVSLLNIVSATLLTSTDQVLHNKRYIWDEYVSDTNVTGVISNIRVTIQTNTHALYEALITCTYSSDHDITHPVITLGRGDISRINPYGHSADCISMIDRSLEPFCTCK